MKLNAGVGAASGLLVVPYIGTWIETPQQGVAPLVGLVVPYIGTWIETQAAKRRIMQARSYLI